MIAETGLAVSGPNCMGNICAKSRLVTLTEDRQLTLRQGPVALVGQSGGMLLYLNVALEERGIAAEYLITSGNEAGLGIPDYVAFFADQPELKVIILYIEAIWDLEKFKAACRMARKAGKSIVAVKLGQSEDGRAAAMAHTGSLAGTMEAFDAVAGDLGVIRANTLDDAVEITEFLIYTGVPKGPPARRHHAFGRLPRRAARGRGAERVAISRRSPPKPQRAQQRPRRRLDGQQPDRRRLWRAHQPRQFQATIEALEGDPNVDMVLLQEKLPLEAGVRTAPRYISP